MKIAMVVTTLLLKSSIIVAFHTLPSNIISLQSNLKHWSKRVFHPKIDLCSQVHFSQILPGLYLSNARAACDRSVLSELEITHILTIEAHKLPKYALAGTNISTLFIKASDSPDVNLLPYFPISNAFIEEGLQKGNVLVHCHYGVSRSATLVIAFLMHKYRIPYEQAFAYVRQKRRIINPNPGFVEQLKEYERLDYDVKRFKRFEAYVSVHVRKNKNKIIAIVTAFLGILLPITILVGYLNAF